MKLKNFKEWLVENSNAQMGITSIDNPGGFTYNPTSIKEDDDDEPSNYMFFSNLKRIQELAKMILEMDQEKIDKMLNDGHDWANDHVTVAKENLSHVFEFLKGESEVRNESVEIFELVEAHSTAELHRRFTMTPAWWSAWRKQHEKRDGLKIEKDAFAKTYEVKDKDDKVILVFDYARNIIFTNEQPSLFTLKSNIDNKEMEDIRKKAEKLKDDLAGVDSDSKDLPLPKKGKEGKKEKEKEEEAEGELKTDTSEE
jgi:hypothetical protein